MGILTNTHNYLVPAAGTTRAYRETMDFQPGQPVKADFRDMSLDGLSFVPSGVLVDNSRANGDLAIVINEMSWRIVVKAGEFAQMPYPAPYNQTATIEGDGLATVVFVDYPVIPWTSENSGGGTVGGISEIVAGSGISVNSSDPAKPVVANSGILGLSAGSNISIDATDPANPIISATGGGGGGSSNIVGQARGIMVIQNVSTDGVTANLALPVSDPDGLWNAGNQSFDVPAGATNYDIHVGIMAIGNTENISVNIAGTPWLYIPANQENAATYLTSDVSALNDGLKIDAYLPQAGGPAGTLQIMACVTFYSN